jgi:peptide/nickel transport system substrate-binding protein
MRIKLRPLQAACRSLAMATIFIVALVATAGCGGTSSTPASATASQASDSPSVVRIGVPDQIVSLDPAVFVVNTPFVITHFAYGTLTRLTPHGTTIPDLASRWSFSANQLSVTFVLRPGLVFSNGQPVTATDAAASIERSVSSPTFTYGSVITPIKRVEAMGAHTVRFVLRSPFPSLPSLVAEPVFGIFPKSALTQKNFFMHPVSAGLYKIQSLTSTEAVLVANPTYSGPKPVVHELDFRTVPDVTTRLAQLATGQLQVADSLPGTAIKTIAPPARTVVRSLYGSYLLQMNDTVPPLNYVGVRKAISLAIDRKSLVGVVYGNHTQPQYGFWYPGSPWYDANLPSGPNVAAAKKLLVGTPCAHGCTIPMLVPNGYEDIREMSTIVQEDLSQIGITLRLQQLDANVVFQRLYSTFNFSTSINIVFDYTAAPNTDLSYSLYSKGPAKAASSQYSNPTVDAAVLTALATTGSQQDAAMHTINVIFARDLPYVPLLRLVFVSGIGVPASVFDLANGGFYEVGPYTH